MSNPKEEREKLAKWIETWMKAGPTLEQIRREELRKLDTFQAISHLLGPIDFSQEPYCPKPTSGLVAQQAWFKKFRKIYTEQAAALKEPAR